MKSSTWDAWGPTQQILHKHIVLQTNELIVWLAQIRVLPYTWPEAEDPVTLGSGLKILLEVQGPHRGSATQDDHRASGQL